MSLRASTTAPSTHRTSAPYVTIADPDGRIARLTSWALALQFLATTPSKPGVQCLAGAWDDAARAGVAVVLVDGRVALRLGDGSGDPELLACSPPVEAGTWYRVDAAYDDATREARIALAPSAPPVNARLLASASTARGDEHRRALAGAPAWRSVPFVIGAAATGRPGFPECVEHFNGKVDRPRLWADADATDLVADWHLGRSDQPDGTLLDGVVDVSGSGLHGACVNCPTRGVTGPAWSGREPNFRHAPDEYAAIHFHDDDLDDALWPEAFGVDLPADLASGVYAVRLDGGVATGYVPFAVRPGPDGPRAAAALLLPTGSYLAYANDRLSFDVAGTELLIGHTPVVSEFDLQLQRHYDFSGSNYEVHSDGSGFLYSSRRRPIITMDPRYRAWVALDSVWQFPADLCIVDWLDEIGVPFDVITDEDLDREGADLLRPYRVVMTGSHPEYVSEPELDAVEEYVSDGGRLMYLGGNGFYWIVSYHPQKPHVMEVRRSEAGTRPHQAPAGEYYLATNGRLGALWRNKGRPPQRLLGVGFTAQGFDRCSPYLRMPDSHDPRAAFIFDGVGDDEVIGAFGIVGVAPPVPRSTATT